MAARQLTVEERVLMEHALGRHYPHKARDHRNWYAVGPESTEFKVWEQLAVDGLAKRGREINHTGGLVYFHVTDAGKEALDGDG